MAQPFKKFMGQTDSGAKKKERIRQEKKKVRQETKEFFEKKKQEAREARSQGQATGYKPDRGRKEQAARNSGSDGSGATWQRGGEKAGRNTGKTSGFKSSRPGGSRNTERGPGGKEQRFEKRSTAGFKPSRSGGTGKGYEAKGQQGNEAYGQRGSEKAGRNAGKTPGYKPQITRNTEQGSEGKEQRFEKKSAPGIKPMGKGPDASGAPRQRSTGKTEGNRKPTLSIKPQAGKAESYPDKSGKAESNTGKFQKTGTQAQTTNQKPEPESVKPAGSMPLNKFIAHAGICSRRDAVEIVKSGKVIVNGAKILEPGHKVTDKDEIKVNGKMLFARRNLVYILLNKPKDFITTTEDPQGRKTVMDIVRNATPERVYPIGRLDRNTTGVLLLTNDGELAQKLSHPSYEIRKIYEVKLDKPLVKKDFDSLVNGITLEDGFIAPDLLAYADPKDKSVIGIEIHSGRNRIVRRIFEQLGYDVRNLDRVMYANLTKKNVDRGKWRFLTEKEVRLLKYLNSSFTKNKTAARG
ncbi:MAG TPA: pseudouridine synthase [Niastella sp.]